MKNHFFLSILLVLFFFNQASFAQTQDLEIKERKNQIKINLLPVILFNTAQLSYERTIKDNVTIGGSINGSFSKESPSFLDHGGFSDLSFSVFPFSVLVLHSTH